MVTVRVPTALRKLTQNAEEVRVEGKTVGEVIGALERAHPGMKERLCDEKGQLRRFVNIFVRDEDVRFQKNLDTEVRDGDEISIVPAIAGGR